MKSGEGSATLILRKSKKCILYVTTNTGITFVRCSELEQEEIATGLYLWFLCDIRSRMQSNKKVVFLSRSARSKDYLLDGKNCIYVVAEELRYAENSISLTDELARKLESNGSCLLIFGMPEGIVVPVDYCFTRYELVELALVGGMYCVGNNVGMSLK